MPSASGISTNPGRVAALEARHAAIAEQIEARQKNSSASDIEIRLLKKMKLKLKEEIEGLK
jgi:hypothetical protein